MAKSFAARVTASARRLIAMTSLSTLAACATAGGSADPLVFDPALGVNLGTMRQTPTGLFVRDLAVGTGAPVGTGDLVRVRYSLFLKDGKRIEGTEPSDPPYEFHIAGHEVIAGWDEGVTGMRVGGRRQLVVPPTLGYGMHTRGQIPGGSVLVFTIELVQVVH